jgi:peptide/nickel transport system substrate-binding protein
MIRTLLARRVAASLLLALVAAGCTKIQSAAPGGRHTFTIAHTLRFAAAENLVGLNPLVNSQATLGYLSEMTMAYLLRGDVKSEAVVPELATEVPTKANGGISADGKTLTYHLRRGVVWSDGAPFTADDVIFTTKLINDPKTNIISRDGWDHIVAMDEPDKYTVVYHLSKPYAAYAESFYSTIGANPAILPKHLLAGKNVNTDPYNALPVGIGPFKYEAWKRGDSVVLVPNPKYFRGLPKLQRVIYKEIQDRNVVLEELRTHELDMWTPVSPHFIKDVRSIAGVRTNFVPSFYYDHIDFNNSHPVMKDPAVRHALELAVDRRTLNDKINFGVYDLSETVVPPASRFHADVPLVPFNIAAANRLLDADGWVRGSDGVRAKNGLRLSFDFATSAGTPDNDTRIELIRGWWKQLGADVVVRHYLSSLFFDTYADGGIIFGGKFDVVAFAWGGDPVQDLYNTYGCRSFPPVGTNDTRYCNARVTDEMAASRLEYDPAKRTPGEKMIQEQIAKDAPLVVLDTRKDISAYNDDLKNWHPSSLAPFDDMMNVDI